MKADRRLCVKCDLPLDDDRLVLCEFCVSDGPTCRESIRAEASRRGVDPMTGAVTAQLADLIARYQHSNESLHRHHDIGKATCSYCTLVGHNAVQTLRRHPELLSLLVAEWESQRDLVVFS